MKKWIILSSILIPSLLLGCTIAVISGELTEDNRPLLWKNRDVSNPYQEVRYFHASDTTYSFVALVSFGETERAWAGINDVGFGIVNSNSYNLGVPEPANYCDGFIMYQALKRCRNVNDFEELLREYPPDAGYNFAVIDGEGNSAILESSPDSTVKFTPPLSHRYIVRTNFSFSGDPLPRRGIHRYRRARYLIDDLRTTNPISYTGIIDKVSSDLVTPEIFPYPLPYANETDEYPPATFPIAESINRFTSRAAVIIRGVKPGEPKSNGLMITVMGEPVLGVPYPVWVKSRAVPNLLYGGIHIAPACSTALVVKRIVEHFPEHPSWFDSQKYVNLQGKLNLIKQFAYQQIDRMGMLDSVSLAMSQQALASEISRQYDFITQLFIDRTTSQLPSRMLCYPNPFNSRLTIELPLENNSAFDILIANTMGKIVRKIDGTQNIRISWDGTNSEGKPVPSGLYTIMLNNKEGKRWTKSVLLLR